MQTDNEKKQMLTAKRNGYFINVLFLLALLAVSAVILPAAFLMTQQTAAGMKMPLILALTSVLLPSAPFLTALFRTGGLSAAFGPVLLPAKKESAARKSDYFFIGAAAANVMAKFLTYCLTVGCGVFLLVSSLIWRTGALICVQIRLMRFKKESRD